VNFALAVLEITSSLENWIFRLTTFLDSLPLRIRVLKSSERLFLKKKTNENRVPWNVKLSHYRMKDDDHFLELVTQAYFRFSLHLLLK